MWLPGKENDLNEIAIRLLTYLPTGILFHVAINMIYYG